MVGPGMPTTTTRPLGRTMASDCSSEAVLPTQSSTTSAPSVSRPPSTSDRDRARTARASWSWGTAMSAPRSRASSRWWAYLAPTTNVAGCVGRTSRWRAATVARPRVPAPTTATRSSSWMPADSAACTAQAVGSTITASSSEKYFGDQMHLGGMGYEAGRRPTATGVRAEAGLQAGSEVTEGHMRAEPVVAPSAPPTGGTQVAGDAAEHRLDDHPGAGVRRAPRRDRGRPCPPLRPPRGRGRRGS